MPTAPPPVPDLDAKVAFLSRPTSYPDPTARVERRETHTSWLFLTERHVYKLKKPLRYDYLDFGTVADRRRNCEAEVRLNRRLNPDLYLGTVALTEDRGALALDGPGRVVDWLVKMRRLDEDRTLERRLERGRVALEDLLPVARRLAGFYARAAPVVMGAGDYLGRFARDLEANRAELVQPEFGLDARRIDALAAGQRRFLEEQAIWVGERAEAGRIIEAHGDLRPEHIYLNGTPAIIDCLEFNRAFRLLDPADELGFLALECERLGAPWVRAALLDVYRQRTGDDPPPSLVDFYMGFRALLWARLAILHTRRDAGRRGSGEEDKWRARTGCYLALAETHAGSIEPGRSGRPH